MGLWGTSSWLLLLHAPQMFVASPAPALQPCAKACAEGGSTAGKPTKSQVRHALKAFWEATGGPNWDDSSGWNDTNVTSDYCTWNQVQCCSVTDQPGDPQVQAITVFKNNLSGTIPPDFWSSMPCITFMAAGE